MEVKNNTLKTIICKYFAYRNSKKNMDIILKDILNKAFDNPEVLHNMFFKCIEEGEQVPGTDVFRNFADGYEQYIDLNAKEIVYIVRMGNNSGEVIRSNMNQEEIAHIYYIDGQRSTMEEYNKIFNKSKSKALI